MAGPGINGRPDHVGAKGPTRTANSRTLPSDQYLSASGFASWQPNVQHHVVDGLSSDWVIHAVMRTNSLLVTNVVTQQPLSHRDGLVAKSFPSLMNSDDPR